MTFLTINQGKLTKRFLDTDESPQCKKKRKTALKTPTVDSLYQPSSELGKLVMTDEMSCEKYKIIFMHLQIYPIGLDVT